MKIVFLIIVSMLCSIVNASNILLIALDPAKSHTSIFLPIINGLLDRGHTVTSISNTDYKTNNTNHTQVLVVPKFNSMEFLDMKTEATRNLSDCFYSKPTIHCYDKYQDDLVSYYRHGEHFSSFALKSKNVKDFIRNNHEHFDLVVSEMFVEEAMYMFAYKYNAPLVLISPFDYEFVIFSGLGMLSMWSHIPGLYGSYDRHLDLKTRVYNKIMGYFLARSRKLRYIPVVDKLAHRYFKSFGPLPSIMEIESKISLVLLNSLKILDEPRHNADGIIDIAKIHMPPPKPLPDDIQEFLDNAKNGAIYFSFGSMAKISQLPPIIIQTFADVFVKLNMRVLWKFEDETWKFPDNIMIRNWLPQNDILAHKNVKLFISHGGTLGMIEGTYHAVPMLAIPVFGDHFLNSIKLIDRKIGLRLRLENLTYENIFEATSKLLEDPTYRINIQALSKKFHNESKDSITKTLDCMEILIKTGKPCHTISPENEVNFFEKYLLDVILVGVVPVLLILVSIILIIKKFCQFLYRKIFKKFTVTHEKVT